MEGIQIFNKDRKSVDPQKREARMVVEKGKEYVAYIHCDNCGVKLIMVITKGIDVGKFLQGKDYPNCGCKLAE